VAADFSKEVRTAALAVAMTATAMQAMIKLRITTSLDSGPSELLPKGFPASTMTNYQTEIIPLKEVGTRILNAVRL
jgi:hypothetical protein